MWTHKLDHKQDYKPDLESIKQSPLYIYRAQFWIKYIYLSSSIINWTSDVAIVAAVLCCGPAAHDDAAL